MIPAAREERRARGPVRRRRRAICGRTSRAMRRRILGWVGGWRRVRLYYSLALTDHWHDFSYTTNTRSLFENCLNTQKIPE